MFKMEVFSLQCDCQIKCLNEKEKHADGKPFDYSIKRYECILTLMIQIQNHIQQGQGLKNIHSLIFI